MCRIIFLTIFGQFLLLVLHKHRVRLLKIVDFEIQAVYHTLEFGNVCLGLVNSDWGLLDGFCPGVQLLVELVGPIDESPALIVENWDSSALGIALLLPFGECAVTLVNLTLLSLSQLLFCGNAHLGLVNFSFERLVVGAAGLDVVLKVTAVLVFSRYFDSNCLGLLRNLDSLSLLVTVLGP